MSYKPLNSAADKLSASGVANAGSTGLPADAGHAHPAALWVPADNGLIAAAFDPAHAQTSVNPLPTGGTAAPGKLTLTKITVAKTATWSKIWFGLSSTNGAASLTNTYLGVYDTAGTLKGTTADVSSSFLSGSTPKSVDIVTPFTATAGYYFIAILFNGTWTAGDFTLKAAGGGISTNANLVAPNLRYSSMLSAQTTLPSTIDLTGQGTLLIGGGWGSQWYGAS